MSKMSMKSDAELIERILEGDWRNFAVLVGKYESRVYNYVHYLLRNREDTEEVVQDTFVKAYRSLDTFRGEALFSTWLIRIAHFSSLSRFRRKVPEKVSLDALEYEDHTNTEDGPSKNLDLADRKTILAFALEKLKPEERSTVTLFYYNELSIQEISDVTDLSVSNVKVLLHRSRKKLLRILKEMGIKESTL